MRYPSSFFRSKSLIFCSFVRIVSGFSKSDILTVICSSKVTFFGGVVDSSSFLLISFDSSLFGMIEIIANPSRSFLEMFNINGLSSGCSNKFIFSGCEISISSVSSHVSGLIGNNGLSFLFHCGLLSGFCLIVSSKNNLTFLLFFSIT